MPSRCGSFKIRVLQQYRWGSAENLMFNLEGELPSLFPSTVQKCDRIQGEYPETLYEFRPQDIDAKFLSTLENRTLSIGRRLLTRTSNAHEQTKWKRLASAKFTWSCIDEDSQAHNGTGSIDWELRNKMLLFQKMALWRYPWNLYVVLLHHPGQHVARLWTSTNIRQGKSTLFPELSRLEAGKDSKYSSEQPSPVGRCKSWFYWIRLVIATPECDCNNRQTNTTLGTATAKKFWRNPPKRWKTITVLLNSAFLRRQAH